MGRRAFSLLLLASLIGGLSSLALGADQGPINSGETRSSTIVPPSYMDTWTFNGQVGDRVLINSVTTSGTLNTQIILYPPGGGSAEANSLGSDTVDHQLQHTGSYSIVIQDYGLTKSGDYNLTFLKIPGTVSSVADPDGGPIASGQTSSGTINVISDLDAFQFSGQAGDRVIINAVTTSGTLNTQIILYPPGGGPSEANSLGSDTVDYQLKNTGLYTIVIQDYGLSKTGIYNLTFLKIPGTVSSAADPDGGPIASGQTLGGTINVPSDLDAFQFYGQTGERVLINAVTTSGILNTQIILYPPGGGPSEANSLGSDTVDYQLKNTGIYTIVIQDYGLSKIGIYNLTFLKILGTVSCAADPDGGPIASGQTLGGTINVPSDLDAFQFYGQAGDRVLINAVTTSGTLNTQIILYPPGGGSSEANSLGSDAVDYQLKNTGLYTIVIQDYGLSKTGIYNISLSKIPSTQVPGIYNLSPANGATIGNVTGAFTWSEVAGATGYDLYFGQDVTQPPQKIGDNLSSPSMAFPALTRGEVYYWQVVAHTAEGDIQGPYSWFLVGLHPPGSPWLLLLLD